MWRRKWQPTAVFSPGEPPWTEEPGRLQSMGSQRVRDDLAIIPVFLPGESHVQRSLADYSPWGRRELDTTEKLTQCLIHNGVEQGR